MENTTNQIVDFNKTFAMFSEKQIEALKLIITRGAWGSCDMNFEGFDKTSSAFGYFTNQKHFGGGYHFPPSSWSGIIAGISKVIDNEKLNFICMQSNWWGDNSGDMLFINWDLINVDELEKWASN